MENQIGIEDRVAAGIESSGAIDPATLPAPRGAVLEQRHALIEDVIQLADEIGPRNRSHYENLLRAEDYVFKAFAAGGLQPLRQEFTIKKQRFANIVAEIPGHRLHDEIVVIGTHYDSYMNSPGANANAASVAALLAVAREFRSAEPARTIRFVAFVNEEKPVVLSEEKGSRVYVRNCRARGEKIIAMINLESIGHFSNDEGSQRYSMHGRLLPSRGNFLAIVGNGPSRALLEKVMDSLSLNSHVAFEALNLPGRKPSSVRSATLSFWKEKYPAISLTDTGKLRNPHHHKPTDTTEKVDFEWLDQVVEALKQVVTDLALPAELAGVVETPIEWQEPVSATRAAVAKKPVYLLAGGLLGLGVTGWFLGKSTRR